MPYLSWIADSDLLNSVSTLLTKAITAENRAINNFGKNVIDPFSAVFEMSGFQMTYDQWKQNEQTRQAQKTLQNFIGDFHQNILGSCKGWTNMKTGHIIDLENKGQCIIAEVKNKYNTIKGSDRINLYKSLEHAVMDKNSIYKGFTAYHVSIIPQKPAQYNTPFVTSDKHTGAQVVSNQLIRKIDGASFYTLVTGEQNALKDLFVILADVIASITSKPNLLNSQQLNILFQNAYG